MSEMICPLILSGECTRALAKYLGCKMYYLHEETEDCHSEGKICKPCVDISSYEICPEHSKCPQSNLCPLAGWHKKDDASIVHKQFQKEGVCPSCIPYIPEYECDLGLEPCEGCSAYITEKSHIDVCDHWQPKKPATCPECGDAVSLHDKDGCHGTRSTTAGAFMTMQCICRRTPADLKPAEPEMPLTSEEEILYDVILSARKVQEFLWGKNNSGWDLDEWRAMFQKRWVKIASIEPANPHGIVELKKRLLQNAALCIALLSILQQKKPVKTTNLPQYRGVQYDI